MPTPTYTLIDSVTLGASASSVTFSSIPAGGDLVFVSNYEITGGLTTLTLRLNGDTNNANYSVVRMQGNGTTAASTSSASSARLDGDAQTDASKGAILIQLSDYSATDKHKSALVRINNTSDSVEATAFRYASTTAVTSLSLVVTTNFAIGSTFQLYEIAKAV
jgi:hypothetical protein